MRTHQWMLLPEAGWLVAAVLLPLAVNPWGVNAFDLPKAALLRVIVLLMAVGLLAPGAGGERLAADGRDPGSRGWRAAVWAGLALWAVFVLATLTSVNPLVSLWGSYQRQLGLLTLTALAALFVITAARLRTRAQADRLWAALAWGSLPVVAYGLLQAAGLDPLNWRSDAASPLTSTLGRSNFTGSYLVLVLPLTLSRFFAARRWPYLLLATGQAVCLLLTQSRGAYVGATVAGMALLLAWQVRAGRGRLMAIAMAGVAVAIAIVILLALARTDSAPGSVLTGLMGAPTGSTAARLTIWQATASLVAARPLLGYGPDAMDQVFAAVFPPQLVYYQGRLAAVDRAHNLWLDTAMAAGLAGLAALAAFLATVALPAWRRWRTAAEGHEWWLLAGLAAAGAGHLAELQVSFEVIGTAVVLSLLLALAVAAGRGLLEDAAPPAARLGGRRALWLAAPLAAALMVAWVTSARPVLADVASATSQRDSAVTAARLAAGQQAVSLWPVEPEYHVRLAWIYAEMGAFAEAERELDAAQRLLPSHPRVAAAFGDLYVRWSRGEPGHLSQAEAAYRRAVALAPNVAGYHGALAWSLDGQGRTTEAVAEATRAVDLDSTDADAYRLLGQLYSELGQQDRAAWALREAERWSSP